MKKQSKRRVRPASEPALVRLSTNPEIGIAERMAIQAMRGGWADYNNSYRVLADCHGILTLGTRRKKDTSMAGVLKLSMVALLNIFDRYAKTKKSERLAMSFRRLSFWLARLKTSGSDRQQILLSWPSSGCAPCAKAR